jgi:hypothetical protein
MNPLFVVPVLLTLTGDDFQSIEHSFERGQNCYAGCDAGCSSGCLPGAISD